MPGGEPSECYLSQPDAWNRIRNPSWLSALVCRRQNKESALLHSPPSERKAEKLGDDVRLLEQINFNPAACDTSVIVQCGQNHHYLQHEFPTTESVAWHIQHSSLSFTPRTCLPSLAPPVALESCYCKLGHAPNSSHPAHQTRPALAISPLLRIT